MTHLKINQVVERQHPYDDDTLYDVGGVTWSENTSYDDVSESGSFGSRNVIDDRCVKPANLSKVCPG